MFHHPAIETPLQKSYNDVHPTSKVEAARDILTLTATSETLTYTKFLLPEVAVVVRQVHNRNHNNSHLLS